MDQEVTIDGVEFVAIASQEGCRCRNVVCWFQEETERTFDRKRPRVPNSRKLLCIRPTYEVIFMKPEDFLKARMRGDV